MNMKSIITTLITLALATGPLFAQDASDPSSHNHSAQQAEAATSQPAGQNEVSRIGDPWPLDTCVVSGEKLGSMGDPIIKLHEGREVRFCCKGCVGMFEKDPEKYLAKADEAIIEQQTPHYPLDYCIIDTAESVSGDPEADSFAVVGNRLFIYCCPPCDEKVRAEPAKYIEILDQAVIEQQAESYPLETCVISGQPLDSMGGPVNMVVANQLVQLCCAGCEKKVEADPAGTLAKINQAKGGGESHEGTSEKPHATEQKSEAAHGQHGHH
jgi:YHS domain-containing protein